MKDLWHALEERSRAWDALGRQGLAEAIWEDYVSIRFGRRGDPRALEYLYPYLNHASREVREHAIDVAARVFEGRGPKALAALDYFTRNPNLFLRDRAVRVVGAAVAGSPDSVVLEVLAPYLNHRNQSIRKLALVALCEARNKAVQSAALTGLGVAARSSCDEELRRLCLERSTVEGTAAARALVMIEFSEAVLGWPYILSA